MKKYINIVKNLIRWFPVIVKDRDYDDYFIFEILKTKLKYQAKYIGDRDIHVNAKRDAEIMMLCVSLIEKIQDEHYGGEYMDYHESRYKWLDVEGKPDRKQLEIEEISDVYCNIGLCYEKIKNYDLAKFNILKAYSLDNNNSRVKSSLANIYYILKNYDKSLAQKVCYYYECIKMFGKIKKI
jgi:tetratricopeptide (TPR) repeat protein